MAAAAFTGVLKMACGDGSTVNYPVTISDVNDEYYVFADGNNDLVLPSDRGVLSLFDLILSASGTDTSSANVWVNAKDTGEKIMNGANVTTAIQRQFTGSPINISPGARLRIQQKT